MGQTAQESFKTLVLVDLDEVPIVQPRATHSLVAHIEAQGMDEVKDGIRSSAQSGNIAGVRWDFGLHEHDVEARTWAFCA